MKEFAAKCDGITLLPNSSLAENCWKCRQPSDKGESSKNTKPGSRENKAVWFLSLLDISAPRPSLSSDARLCRRGRRYTNIFLSIHTQALCRHFSPISLSKQWRLSCVPDCLFVDNKRERTFYISHNNGETISPGHEQMTRRFQKKRNNFIVFQLTSPFSATEKTAQ